MKAMSPVTSGTGAHALRGSLHTDSLRATGVLYETYSRVSHHLNGTQLSSGRLSLVAIHLPAGLTVTSITFLSATTAAVTPTAQWFALYDSALALLRQTADDTTTAWANNAFKTLNLTSPFVTTYAGLHYLGIMVAAATVPTLAGIGASAAASAAYGAVPILVGTSTTGLTTTAPNPAAALTVKDNLSYAYVS